MLCIFFCLWKQTEAFRKKPVKSVSTLIPPLDTPLPPTVSALGYFYCDVFGLLRLFRTLSNRFDKILGNI